MEHRMKCKVCGKIWCFTDKDTKDNLSNLITSGVAAIGGIASVLGGTTAQQHLNYDIMERNQAKIVDYRQCPNCRSKDVIELSEEEWGELQLKESFANARVSINANATTEALLSRVKLLLEDKDWPNANAYCDAVLDTEPENAMAYVYKLMAELCVPEQADLANYKVAFDTKPNYQRAMRFADDNLRQTLEGYITHINERNEQERLNGLYENACASMRQSTTEETYKNAAALFAVIKGYKDADNLQAECLKKAERARLEEQKAAEKCKEAEEQRKAEKARTAKFLPLVIMSVVVGIILIAVGIFVAYMSFSSYFRWHDVFALLSGVWAVAFLLNGVWWCFTAFKAKSVGKSAIKAPAILSVLLVAFFVVLTVVFNMI